jgi:type II secretory pathway component PulJ
MKSPRTDRRGYALMLVLVFIVLFSAILGVAWRRVASVLRLETLSEVRRQCDSGSIQVLAEAMKLLETCLRLDTASNVASLPGSSPQNEFCETLPDPSDPTNPAKYRHYIVTFAPTDGDATGRKWTVSVKTATSEEIGSRSQLSTLLANPNS